MLGWLRNRFGNKDEDKESAKPAVQPSATFPVCGISSKADAPITVRRQDAILRRWVRTQWQFGDWESLGKLQSQCLDHYPGRAELMMYAAAGQLQLGNVDKAREQLNTAQTWGCDESRIIRILVAGVHNSLGNAQALVANQGRALEHFENSLRIFDPGCEVRLLLQARAQHQAQLLKMPQRGLWLPLLQARGKQRPGRQRRRRLDGPTSIVIAGMRHSGSTALFNIVRLALDHAAIEFVSGYSEHQRYAEAAAERPQLRLVKTHEFRDDIAHGEGIILTTRRDLRDTVASASRRGFELLKRLGGPVEYAKYNRILHDIWQPLSDFEFEYEAFMANPLAAIKSLLRFLGLDEALAQAIAAEVAHLPQDNYALTLLSPTHVTDPERKHSFHDSLAPEVVEKITSDHRLWLEEYGYHHE